MIANKIKVAVPATVSNIGCAFDAMGFALDLYSEELTLKITKDNKLKISNVICENGNIPLSVEKNTCTKAIKTLLEEKNIKVGFDIKIKKFIGFGSGLGSSAASAVAGVYAVNKLLKLRLTKNELLKYALEGEKVASKALHADNVAPCLFGGVVLIRSLDPVDIIKLPYPKNLFCTVIHPKIKIKTSEARKIIPQRISLRKATRQWANVGALVAGFMKEDIAMIGKAVEDHIVEPKRSSLIPGYFNIKESALNESAVACNISGSGPALFALSDNKTTAIKVGKAMDREAKKNDLRSSVYITKINNSGPKVIG